MILLFTTSDLPREDGAGHVAVGGSATRLLTLTAPNRRHDHPGATHAVSAEVPVRNELDDGEPDAEGASSACSASLITSTANSGYRWRCGRTSLLVKYVALPKLTEPQFGVRCHPGGHYRSCVVLLRFDVFEDLLFDRRP